MKNMYKFAFGFLSGALTTTIIMIPALYSITRLSHPRWVDELSKKHDFSSIVEELYQDHITSGDIEYELYNELLCFNKEKQGEVRVKSGEIEYLLFRKLF